MYKYRDVLYFKGLRFLKISERNEKSSNSLLNTFASKIASRYHEYVFVITNQNTRATTNLILRNLPFDDSTAN